MNNYDVIIIGGGPAGLKCAEVLGKAGKNILLLEKKAIFGEKLCAGGLTMKDMEVLPLPDSVIEHRISRAAIHSKRQRAETLAPKPFLFTVNRKELGAYQGSLLDDLKVDVKMNSHVTGINKSKVILKDGREYGYKFLVGAEGYSSVVRKYLNLPVQKKLIGFQYTIPKPDVDPVLEIFLDDGKFKTWYAWIFPHRKSIAVGFCCDPTKANHQKMKTKFQDWLDLNNIDPGTAILGSFPVACDYQGYRFNNVFLVGEAAGLASGLTGEGIYQSLVSGREVAKMILDPGYRSQSLEEVLKYNRVLQNVMLLFRIAGPVRGLLYEFLIYLMNRKWLRDKINSNFM